MNDTKIVRLMRDGKRTQAFFKLYHGYPPVEKLILSKGGTKEDAKDIFQEALIVFYQKAKSDQFRLTAAISTYLYSVCRFLWKDQLSKRNKIDHVNNDAVFENIKDEEELSELIEQESKYEQVEEVLIQIGDKCLTILKLFYYKNLSMKKIAAKLDLKSEKVAKNQKYKCLERAKLKLKGLQPSQ